MFIRANDFRADATPPGALIVWKPHPWHLLSGGSPGPLETWISRAGSCRAVPTALQPDHEAVRPIASRGEYEAQYERSTYWTGVSPADGDSAGVPDACRVGVGTFYRGHHPAHHLAAQPSVVWRLQQLARAAPAHPAPAADTPGRQLPRIPTSTGPRRRSRWSGRPRRSGWPGRGNSRTGATWGRLIEGKMVKMQQNFQNCKSI